MTQAPSLIALLKLVGVSYEDTGCLLIPNHLVHLGAALLDLCPADTTCALGGPFGALADIGDPTHSAMTIRHIGPEPFLALAGAHGALVVLADEQPDGYQTQIVTDPDAIDRVLLVLSQFGGATSWPIVTNDPVVQNTFITTIVAALLNDDMMRDWNLRALLPAEQHWLDVAHAILTHEPIATCLTLPHIGRMFEALDVQQALIGEIDSNQEGARVCAAFGGPAPESLSIEYDLVAKALHERQIVSAFPGPDFELQLPDGNQWAADNALTVAPLLDGDTITGALLIVSRRVLSKKERATIAGLAALLGRRLRRTQPPSERTTDEQPTTQPVVYAWDHPTTPATIPLTQPTPNSAPQRPQTPVALHPALFEYLSDGILIADMRGRIVVANQVALYHFGQAYVAGASLIENGDTLLTDLLTDAVMGESVEARLATLASGQDAYVSVVEAGPDLWAFVLQFVAVEHPAAVLEHGR
jgi:PAS domain-containing protein